MPSILLPLFPSFPPLPSTQSISLWVSDSEPWGVWQPVCHFITDLPLSSTPPTLFFPLLPLFSPLAHLLAVSRWPLLSLLPLFLTLSLFFPDLFFTPLISILYNWPLTLPDGSYLSPSLCVFLCLSPHMHVDECNALADIVTQTCSFIYKVSFYSQSEVELGKKILYTFICRN